MLKRSFSPDQSGRKILFITIIIAFAFMLTSCSKKTTSPEGGLSAPSNLQITLIVDNQIKLNWIDNSTNETKFLIDRKEGVFDWFENYGEVEANITAFTDNIPTNSDTVYSYRVRAFDGNDYSEYSVPVGWFAPCTAPTNLQLEQFAQDSIKLTWQDNSIGELNFRIDRKIGSEEWEEEYKILEPDTTTYIDYNPSLYDTCYYKVFAACGDSYSDSTQNYFIPFLPAPSNLEIDTLYATSVKLTWQDNCEGEDGYLVYKKEDESDWDSTNVPPNTEEWTDEDVIPGIVNYYKVCAYVDSNYSAYIEANINTLPAPTNLQIEQLNVTNFKLIWQDNSIFEQGFKIDRKIDNEEWINELGYVDSNITEWIDNSVGRNYEVVYYRVYGYYEEYNSNKIESNSNIVFPDPSNLTYEKLTISSIKLNWTDNSNGEDGFKIDKKVGENYWQLDYVIIGENVEEWTDENAEINETIQYRIYAYCGNNISASIETGEIDNTFPAPSDLTYQKLTISSINLNWIDNSNGEDGFKIDKKVGENEWQLDYAIVGENIEEWTDENAEINETIQYRIYAYCGNNSSNSIETGEIDNSIPAPSNLDIEVLSETFVKLTWQDNSEFEDGFKIDHKSGEENWEICYGLVEINIEEWVDTEPVSGEVNYYRVYAYSGIYYSLYAQDSIYLFNDTIPPSKVHLTPHLCDVGDPGCTDRTNGIDAVPTGSELTYNWMK
ncbi:MAG: fibronectin type III domain-containing protein, partial [Candidatus Cloacimonetes bacterium]|nr:fibronectin type III domain-containing protein [Candidatus Cloacimonadota bacterium]